MGTIRSADSAVGAVVDQVMDLDVIVGVEGAGVDSEEPGAGVEGAVVRKGAILGALSLYLDFINLFLMLLRIFGGGRD